LDAATKWRVFSIILTVVFLTGCGNSHAPVDYAPNAPTGLFSITGDGKVTLYWDYGAEPDIFEYAVYSSAEEFGMYELEGTTTETFYTVYMTNGVTRYFAVAAIDYAGNESELSYETVWDTPRPEGRNLTVFALFYDEYQTNADRCALDFSDYADVMVQALDNTSNDIYIDNYEETVYINAWDDDTDIALFGYSASMQEVDYVDPDQYDWDNDGYLVLVEDYSYIIWTWDNHFALVRVQEVYQDRVILEWAYQTEEGNPQLKISGKGNTGDGAERSLKLRHPGKRSQIAEKSNTTREHAPAGHVTEKR